jgi:hypothetical protein
MAKFVDDDDEAANSPETMEIEIEEKATSYKAKHIASDDDDDEPKGKKSKVDLGTEISFGDDASLPKQNTLERMRPEKKGEILRFSILEAIKPKMANTHYIDKKGTYRCMTPPGAKEPAFCCEKLGDSSTRIIALVLQYTSANPKDGSFKDKAGNAIPVEYEIKYLQLSPKNFRQITTCYDEDGNPYDIDLRIMKEDKAGNGPKGYEFSRIRAKATWKSIPEMVEEVNEAIKPYLDGKKMAQKLGKVASLTDFKAAIAAAQLGAEDADIDDLGSC